eukprot:1161844-Pelagomonas_calceolata.AAC.14
MVFQAARPPFALLQAACLGSQSLRSAEPLQGLYVAAQVQQSLSEVAEAQQGLSQVQQGLGWLLPWPGLAPTAPGCDAGLEREQFRAQRSTCCLNLPRGLLVTNYSVEHKNHPLVSGRISVLFAASHLNVYLFQQQQLLLQGHVCGKHPRRRHGAPARSEMVYALQEVVHNESYGRVWFSEVRASSCVYGSGRVGSMRARVSPACVRNLTLCYLSN